MEIFAQNYYGREYIVNFKFILEYLIELYVISSYCLIGCIYNATTGGPGTTLGAGSQRLE